MSSTSDPDIRNIPVVFRHSFHEPIGYAKLVGDEITFTIKGEEFVRNIAELFTTDQIRELSVDVAFILLKEEPNVQVVSKASEEGSGSQADS